MVSRASRILVPSVFSRELVEQRYPAAAGRIRQARGGVDASFLAPPAETPAVVRGRYGSRTERCSCSPHDGSSRAWASKSSSAQSRP